MGAKRKAINQNIKNDVVNYFKNENNFMKFREDTKDKNGDDKIPKRVFLNIIKDLEKREEILIQRYAHMMIPNEKALYAHADRFDLKISLRKYLRQQIQDYLDTHHIFKDKV